MTLKQKLKKLTTFFKWLVFTFPHIKIRIKHKLKAIQIKPPPREQTKKEK